MIRFGIMLPGFVPAKMPYQRSSVMKDVALSTAPRYTPGPRLGGADETFSGLGSPNQQPHGDL